MMKSLGYHALFPCDSRSVKGKLKVLTQVVWPSDRFLGIDKFNRVFFATVLVWAFMLPGKLQAQAVTTTFTYPLPTTFVPPTGIVSVTVECWGGGGSGGGNISTAKGGGGGGGGGYSRSVLAVVPLISYTVQVGFGGVQTTADGVPGADSYFNPHCSFLNKMKDFKLFLG